MPNVHQPVQGKFIGDKPVLGFVWYDGSCWCRRNPSHPHGDCGYLHADGTRKDADDIYTRYDFKSYEDMVQNCFDTCTSQNGYHNTYASDTSSGSTDLDFWDHYTTADIVSFKVHKTDGHCYCMTDRPVSADTCSEGYTFESNTDAYDIYYIHPCRFNKGL